MQGIKLMDLPASGRRFCLNGSLPLQKSGGSREKDLENQENSFILGLTITPQWARLGGKPFELEDT
jgi:hypothetical protein